MQRHMVIFLRVMAATLMCVSGVGLIAGLWLRELTPEALADALIGAVYMIIVIGLFGTSHFALAIAIAIPAAVNLAIYYTMQPLQQVHLLRFAIDGVVVCFSALVLWQVRWKRD